MPFGIEVRGDSVLTFRVMKSLAVIAPGFAVPVGICCFLCVREDVRLAQRRGATNAVHFLNDGSHSLAPIQDGKSALPVTDSVTTTMLKVFVRAVAWIRCPA